MAPLATRTPRFGGIQVNHTFAKYVTKGIKEIDRGAKALLHRLKRYQKSPPMVRVGVIGSKAAEDHPRTTTAQVAAYHELGAGVPRRSWLLDGLSEQQRQIDAFWQKIGAKATDKSFLRELGRFGAAVAGLLQQRLADGIGPALSQKTVDAKGSSVPLIDTGQLRTAITSDVKE